MYEYLQGMVTYVSPYYIVLETSGVGYKLQVANPFYFSNKKEKLKVYVYQVVREDGHSLYGFSTFAEKQLFEKLIKVSGIGPKSALAIMAIDDHQGLIQAVETENITYLTKFPGVGKKTAQQIVIDLAGKLDELRSDDEITIGLFDEKNHQALEEALEALKALGYSEREVKKITPQLEKEDCQATDEYLRVALRLIMKK